MEAAKACIDTKPNLAYLIDKYFKNGSFICNISCFPSV